MDALSMLYCMWSYRGSCLNLPIWIISLLYSVLDTYTHLIFNYINLTYILCTAKEGSTHRLLLVYKCCAYIYANNSQLDLQLMQSSNQFASIVLPWMLYRNCTEIYFHNGFYHSRFVQRASQCSSCSIHLKCPYHLNKATAKDVEWHFTTQFSNRNGSHRVSPEVSFSKYHNSYE